MCSAKKNEIMSLIGQMNEHDIKLNVIALDFADDLAEDEDEGPKDSSEDEDGKPDKKGGKVQNLTENQKKTREFLDQVVAKVKGMICPASVAMEIYRQLRKKETSARTKYRGAFEIAAGLQLNVQVYARTSEAIFPSLKKASMAAETTKSDTQGLVKQERSYAEIDDPDNTPVPDEKLLKAFSYGKQVVPVDADKEKVLKFESGERHFQLLGFALEKDVPRHHSMEGVDVVLPINSEKNIKAFTGIVLAMIESKRVIIARLVATKNAAPKLVALFPAI